MHGALGLQVRRTDKEGCCRAILLGLCISLTMAGACAAQGWPRWADEAFGNSSRDRGWKDRTERQENVDKLSEEVRNGGPRPDIAPAAPPTVAFPYDYPANSIVIDTGGRALYYVLADKQAYRYAIAVGREGFSWTGSEKVSRKQEWPDWYPPAEMRQRDPHLPMKMTGGLRNPLGARALYLGDTLYRIHGTNDESTIGRAESSGCFRMLNANVAHLATIAEVGTSVSVVPSLPARQDVVSQAKAG
jgi:lipoprotein-anchoring transpeptidase ErfK/SrfK